MRFSKSSLSTAMAVGVAAACLVGAGTAGAVAGQLIGSDDIARHGVEKKNLAPGAVSWNRIAGSAQAQIEALAGQDGAPGPVGPQGERGLRGLTGEDGAALVGWNVYQNDPSGEASEMVGYFDDLTLPESGSYLVTVSGFMYGPGAIAVGPVDDQFDFSHACWGVAPVEMGLPVAPCTTTYTFEGSRGDVLDVQLLGSLGGGSPEFPAMAEVSLLKVSGDVPRYVDPCGGMTATEKRSFEKKFSAVLGEDAAQVC